MEEQKLIELINDITFKKIPYCLVCFRLETDRRLVRPKAVAEFLRTTSTPKYARDKWVCHICERQAERAMRLFRTMRIARDVSAAMWQLSEKNYSSERVLQVLPVHLSINSNKRKEVSPERLLESMRRLGHLAQTNVLVVNTHGIVEMDPLQTEDGKDTASPDTIVLDDDEDTTSVKDMPPTLVPIEKLLEPPQVTPTSTIATQPNTQTILIQSENSIQPGNVYLYTLPVNFQQIPIPTVVQNNTFVIDPNPPLTNINQLKATNDLKSGNFRSVNTLRNPSGMQLNTSQLNLGTQLNVGTQFNVDAKSSIAEVSELDTALKSIIGDKEGNICMIENPVSLKETVEVADELPKEERLRPRAAVMNSSRIDWEDKIPMDVISFVDANDPNAGEVLDGMTIVPESRRQSSRRKRRADVIDVD